MEVDKTEQDILNKAIGQWETENILSTDKAQELRNSIQLRKTERQLIAQYFFIIAFSCILLAFSAIFIDDKIIEKIKVYFSINNAAIAIIISAISIAWFWFINRNKDKFNNVRKEFYLFFGGLAIITDIIYICKDLSPDKFYVSVFMLGFFGLMVLSILFRSKVLWLSTLLCFTCWFNEFSQLHSINYLFLYMNIPMRYVAFGLLLLAIAFFQVKYRILGFSGTVSYIYAMVILFVAMWMVSIFGNYNYLDAWLKVRQVQVLAYAIPFGIISLITLFLGIKYKNDIARDFGFTFLLINLYTRYFEYFWDTMNKGIFFSILAITFWFIGRWIENNRKWRIKIKP